MHNFIQSNQNVINPTQTQNSKSQMDSIVVDDANLQICKFANACFENRNQKNGNEPKKKTKKKEIKSIPSEK